MPPRFRRHRPAIPDRRHADRAPADHRTAKAAQERSGTGPHPRSDAPRRRGAGARLRAGWSSAGAPASGSPNWMSRRSCANCARRNPVWSAKASPRSRAIRPTPRCRTTAPRRNRTRNCSRKGMLLIDSGAQYLGGTTDITRVLGTGRDHARTAPRRDAGTERHDRVVARAIPARGVRPATRCAGARTDLGLRADYGHGTGHGVGYSSTCTKVRRRSVRRAPVPRWCRWSRHDHLDRTGHLQARTARHAASRTWRRDDCGRNDTEFGEFLAFETLTLCPFDTRLLEPSLLDRGEIAWLDDYHAERARTTGTAAGRSRRPRLARGALRAAGLSEHLCESHLRGFGSPSSVHRIPRATCDSAQVANTRDTIARSKQHAMRLLAPSMALALAGQLCCSRAFPDARNQRIA